MLSTKSLPGHTDDCGCRAKLLVCCMEPCITTCYQPRPVFKSLCFGLHHTQAERIPTEDHARWRYLISTDGYTASCRFGRVLKMNSVVLKVGVTV